MEGFDLSPRQRRLWSAAGSSGAWEARAVFLLEGGVDPARLRRALDILALRHEILRTRFPKPAWSKVPTQVIDGAPRVAWTEGPPGSGDFDLDAQPLQASLAEDGPGRHRLTLRLPVLAADARTFAILLPELAAAYAGRTPGDDPLQAADYAAWQAELLDPADAKGGLARAFWARHELQPNQGGAFRAETVEVPLDRELHPAGVLAGFAALLSRVLGESTVVIGRVFDGRPFDDLATAAGPHSRPLPVALDCPAGLTLAELTARAAAAEAEAAGFQEYGVGDEESPAEPFAWLFESRTRPAPVTADGVTFSLLSADAVSGRGTALIQDGDSLRLRFDAAHLSRAEAERLAARLARVLAAPPETPLGDLDLLDEAERRALLTEVALGPEPADLGPTVQAAFARQAALTPDASALSREGRRLSYAELDAETNRLAWHLRNLGVTAEERVGLYLERSAEAIVAMLAILKAGGAYVPLDPAFPRERLALMLEDAAPKVIVTDAAHAGGLPETGARVVLLDDERAASSGAPPDTALPESLAYVLFTSGSTGRPKGVAVEHRQVLAYTAGVLERMGSPAGQVWATVTTLAADLGNTMVFPALLAGGCLEVVAQERAMEPRAFAELVAGAGIDALKIVPSQLQALLASLPAEQALPRKLLVLGGEAADAGLIGRLATPERAPRVFNHYGPTETTVGALAGPLEPGNGERPPLGRPLAGVRAIVVDGAGRLAPWGVPGELLIGGAGVARGYLGRPDATAERFVPDPHGPAGARAYRTGDRARVLADGRLEFLGRLDGQIKLRGFRIEPGEIEAALRRHPAVRDAAVLLREDAPGERRLVAYLAARRGEEPTTADLRAFLRDRLPDYMTPAAFVTLPALPLTPNGKLDRRALPAPGHAGEAERPFTAPRTPVEEQLAGIWSQVLRVERIGVHDNFFDLGGDSILAIQAIGKATRAGLALKPRDLFQHQTVAELAGVAGGAAAREETGPATGTFPLTPIQRWFFAEGFADPHHWNQAVTLELAAPLSPEALREALARLAAHHDALRLRFTPDEQTYAAETTFFLEDDAAALQAGFDLAAGPLFGAALESKRLVLAAHHLVVDGVSWRILLEDLTALLSGAAPPPRTTSFGEWAMRLADFARNGRFSGELGLWREMSAAPPLPAESDGPALVSTSAVATASLSEEETRRLLQEAPAALDASIQEILLAGLAMAVTGWTGRPEVGVLLEGHGREELASDVDLSRTVGWFTTHYPVLLDVGSRPDDPAAVTRAVAERLRRIPHNGLGYGVLRHLAPEGRELAAPPPGLSFNYLGQLDGAESALGRVVLDGAGAARSPRGHRERPFNAGAYVLDGRLHLTWGYSASLHRPATAERLVEGFAAALRRLLDSAGKPLPGPGADLLARIARQVGAAKDRTHDAG